MAGVRRGEGERRAIIPTRATCGVAQTTLARRRRGAVKLARCPPPPPLPPPLPRSTMEGAYARATHTNAQRCMPDEWPASSDLIVPTCACARVRGRGHGACVMRRNGIEEGAQNINARRARALHQRTDEGRAAVRARAAWRLSVRAREPSARPRQRAGEPWAGGRTMDMGEWTSMTHPASVMKIAPAITHARSERPHKHDLAGVAWSRRASRRRKSDAILICRAALILRRCPLTVSG